MQNQERFPKQRSGALVDIDKRMIGDNAEGVVCGEFRNRRTFINEGIFRPRQSRLWQFTTANTLGSAMFGKLLFVNCENNVEDYPMWFVIREAREAYAGVSLPRNPPLSFDRQIPDCER